MRPLERIARGASYVLEWAMKLAGLITAVKQMLLDPAHATSAQLLLSGVLIMGGQATKDLLLGLVDRLMAQTATHHPAPAPDRPRGEVPPRQDP